MFHRDYLENKAVVPCGNDYVERLRSPTGQMAVTQRGYLRLFAVASTTGRQKER
ncbi:MAG: hypothetical protein IGS49_21535 [Chlorogloeopsis fritschii C42_A2020_084]|uniref:hypothetical protein n=1 Tax=Chlorogloeopsis fritschii TaxID=1124 RepID=UPI001A01AA10|nr:hypothetical protein [Chlorogloeopsis fritschii]MBF2007953.1 hypothetical protein [Chlorogloeopsis fritschii C42_A2020_084]